MDSSTVDVKHDAKVDGYAAQNCKTVDEGPVRCIQRDLTNGGGNDKRSAAYSHKIISFRAHL